MKSLFIKISFMKITKIKNPLNNFSLYYELAVIPVAIGCSLWNADITYILFSLLIIFGWIIAGYFSNYILHRPYGKKIYSIIAYLRDYGKNYFLWMIGMGAFAFVTALLLSRIVGIEASYSGLWAALLSQVLLFFIGLRRISNLTDESDKIVQYLNIFEKKMVIRKEAFIHEFEIDHVQNLTFEDGYFRFEELTDNGKVNREYPVKLLGSHKGTSFIRYWKEQLSKQNYDLQISSSL